MARKKSFLILTQQLFHPRRLWGWHGRDQSPVEQDLSQVRESPLQHPFLGSVNRAALLESPWAAQGLLGLGSVSGGGRAALLC